MKTAISLPDNLFEDAERLAGRLQMSRSQLYGKALREYLDCHEPDQVTEAINTVVADLEDNDDLFVSRAASHTLENVEWIRSPMSLRS